jgi:arsenate reductase
MSNYKVYHNPRCSKSRMAVDYLDTQNKEYEVVEYLKTSPSVSDLTDILEKLGMKAEELIRKGEPDFKENFKGKTLSENEWIEAMVKFPKLIERPIVMLGGKAVVARPTEKIGELI